MLEKILIITHNKERHFYFINEIVSKFNSVSAIIIGAKYSSKNKNYSILKRIKNSLLNILFKKYGLALYSKLKNAENEHFKNQKNIFFIKNKERKIQVFDISKEKKSINDEKYLKIITKIKPKIIVVMGSSLLSSQIIKQSNYVLNLHTGLSPYYRGSNSNLWPIVNKDYGKNGFTIHQISTGIDSGDIIYSGNCKINKNDNFGTINSKNIKEGVKYICKAIIKIKKNKLMKKKQWEKGKVYYNRDFNNYIAYKYFKNIEKYLYYSSLNNLNKNIKFICNGKFME